MRVALVVPSNREAQLDEFLQAWRLHGDWDEIIVVEDAPQRTFALGRACHWPLTHVSHAEIDQRLGGESWIISRRDSAIRAFGFLLAAEHGADWILTLDDDCRPVPGSRPICAAHLAALRSHAVCQPTAGMRTRGLPYRNLGRLEPLLNMGLWRGVPDLDGAQGLLQPQRDFVPPAGSSLAHAAQRYPLCGMNLFFHRSLLPALYFPLMGEGQPYRRFDDIWAGWIFQRAAQHCGIAWSFGEPHVEHVRASCPFKNLRAEAPGIELNETLWEKINSIELAPSSRPDLAVCVRDVGFGLACDADDYLSRLGSAILTWERLASREA